VLAGSDGVGMARLQGEAGTARMEVDAGLFRDDAAAPLREQRVDEGYRKAVTIDDGEIDRVGSNRRRGQAQAGRTALHVDPADKAVDGRIGQHVGDGHIGHIGIGNERIAHGVGEASRLHQQMEAGGVHRIGAAWANAGQHLQDDQRDNSLIAGR
jgi:hypothetical protein